MEIQSQFMFSVFLLLSQTVWVYHEKYVQAIISRLDEGLCDHRDPKVIRYAQGQKWIMITALLTIWKCRFYPSTDLINWTHFE